MFSWDFGLPMAIVVALILIAWLSFLSVAKDLGVLLHEGQVLSKRELTVMVDFIMSAPKTRLPADSSNACSG